MSIYKDCDECKGNPLGVLLATHYNPCKTCKKRSSIGLADTLPPVTSGGEDASCDLDPRSKPHWPIRRRKRP
jgi:hypothetical protein